MVVKIEKFSNKEEILVVSSRVVAEDFEKEHAKVLRSISELISEITPKLALSFFIKSEYKDNMNRNQTEYLLTRDGFSLLVMGFTGEKALNWKLKYIEAFNEMEKELKRLYNERKQWEIEREKGIVIRHILTDTIKMKVADSPNKKFMYPNYTKLIYKILFGKTVKELQEYFGVKAKESIRDYLTVEQLKEVESMEMLISSLINIGMSYAEIKDFIENKNIRQLTV